MYTNFTVVRTSNPALTTKSVNTETLHVSFRVWVPLQVWSGPEGSRKLRFPDFLTTVQDGGRLSGCLEILVIGRPWPKVGQSMMQWEGGGWRSSNDDKDLKVIEASIGATGNTRKSITTIFIRSDLSHTFSIETAEIYRSGNNKLARRNSDVK